MTDDPVVRSDALDRQLADSEVIQGLTQFGRTNRRLVGGLALLMVLVIALAIAIAVVAIKAHSAAGDAATAAKKSKDAATAATSAAAQARTNCLAGNSTRADQLKLWTYVLSFPPPPGETQQARARRLVAIARFRAFIHKAFAPRDCDHLTVGKPGAFPSPLPTATASAASTAVVVVPGPTSTVTTTPSSRPSSRPSRAPSTSPSPTASPTPRCVRVVVTACLPPSGGPGAMVGGMTSHTRMSKARLILDAKNRATRTFVQGLAIDVLVALAVATYAIVSNPKPIVWATVGASLGRTVVQSAASYVMRRFLDQSKVPTPTPPEPVPAVAAGSIDDGDGLPRTGPKHRRKPRKRA